MRKKNWRRPKVRGTNDAEIALHGALVDEPNFLKGLVGDYAAELNPTEAANYSQQLIALHLNLRLLMSRKPIFLMPVGRVERSVACFLCWFGQ